jgi:hypothetical protein
LAGSRAISAEQLGTFLEAVEANQQSGAQP